MIERLVCWWSAGVASAVATHVALQNYRGDAVIAYCDLLENEHPDNARFLADCERWYERPIVRLRSQKYASTWDVYEKTRYLVGVNGARCTTELKKKVRAAFEQPGDEQVFGFTIDERARAARFEHNNPLITAGFPLIENGLTHADCAAVLREAGIAAPAMYGMGYRNNNCLGCVKGGMGYWNKIRVDFPAVFDRMATLERTLNVAILKKTGAAGERLRVFLDELDPGAGRYEAEPEVECGPACEAVFGGS